jgi:L-lactate dehydrogenase (cytochrome)/(S)-mandelate dehydrogenase
LDDAISGIAALSPIVKAVDGKIPVMVDGGFRRGSDIVKALALGAKLCLIGRPHLWGVSVAGEAGVSHVINIYRQEMTRTMGLLGANTIADIRPDMIIAP